MVVCIIYIGIHTVHICCLSHPWPPYCCHGNTIKTAGVGWHRRLRPRKWWCGNLSRGWVIWVQTVRRYNSIIMITQCIIMVYSIIKPTVHIYTYLVIIIIL